MLADKLLQSIKISVKLPVMVRVDNVGEIFMAGNVAAISHTKHVNMRHKYVHEYVKDGRVKIVFLKSAENDSITQTR